MKKNKAIRKKELLDKLRACANDYDTERGHVDADVALLEYINDKDITDAFESFEKWYA